MTRPGTTANHHTSATHPELIKFSYLSRTALFRHIKSNAQLYDYRCRTHARHSSHHHACGADMFRIKGSTACGSNWKIPFLIPGASIRSGHDLTRKPDLHHITSHTHLEMVIIYDTAPDFLHVLPERPTPSTAASRCCAVLFGSGGEQVSGS